MDKFFFPKLGLEATKSLDWVCPPANVGDVGLSLGGEDPLEEEMATHSSSLALEIPWTEESGGLQSMRSQKVGHD